MMKRGLRILIHLIVMFVCLFLTSWYFGLFRCVEKADYIKVLSDAFFITGGVFTGVGIVSFSIKEGVFDSLGKASRNIEDGQTIKEYNKGKQSRRRWLRTLTICGVGCLLVAVILCMLC